MMPRRFPWEPPRFAVTQMLCFKDATANALTTVFAGFAFTTTSLPNIILFPALVAGLTLVLILHSPWTVNNPLLFTSLAPTSARTPMSFEQIDFFKSVFAASASARTPFDIGAPAFIGNIVGDSRRSRTGERWLGLAMRRAQLEYEC